MKSVEKMIADMKSGVFDFTKDGKCSNCGECCSNLLPMTEKELNRIKQYVKQHNIKDQALKVTSDKVFNLVCPFRDEGSKKCVIYEARPTICREFRCDKTNYYSNNMKEYCNSKIRIIMVREEIYR